MTSISLLKILKFIFMSVWHIENYFQFKNNCMTYRNMYLFLNMYITKNANKFLNFFVKVKMYLLNINIFKR